MKSKVKDAKNMRNNSSNLIQNQITIYEQEKRMKEEKMITAENINSIFRNYEKIYNKAFKKYSPK